MFLTSASHILVTSDLTLEADVQTVQYLWSELYCIYAFQVIEGLKYGTVIDSLFVCI